MDYFTLLPIDIALDILTRVPTESVLECKLVCTSWKNHVRHSSFSRMHLHHINDSTADSGELGFVAMTSDDKLYYFKFNENDELRPIQRIRRVWFTPPFSRLVKIAGSNNGLICLAKDLSVCIFNPITDEEVILPKIKIIETKSCRGSTRDNDGMISFGYVSSTDEYKVVGIYELERKLVEVQIYTLGSGKGWRNLGKFNHSEFSFWNRDVPGIFADGALYWLHDELEKITTFDLAEEKFCESLSPPPLPQDGNWLYYRIYALDGFLCFSVYLDVEGVEFNDIWQLEKKSVNHEMKDQEEHESSVWNKKFRIDDKILLFAGIKSDHVLTLDYNCLNIYDKKTTTSKRIVKFKERLVKVSPHKNTFVSLKELGEEDTKATGFVEGTEGGAWDYTFEQL